MIKAHIGRADLLLVTLDTLRYDAAQQAWQEGKLPTLAPYLAKTGWEKRHSPGSFTYAAHHAFFAGFLPTPARPGGHTRLFAAEFAGSATTGPDTWTFPQATLPEGLRAQGYHTICVGGTGFFSRQNALASVLPGLFDEAHWRPELGVTCPESPQNQVRQCLDAIRATSARLMLFLNVSAIHQPNWFYGAAQGPDTLATHTAALSCVDQALGPLLQALKARGPTFAIVCSDHGTAYGEEGYAGHRLGHDVVWTVPYAEFWL